MARNGRIPMRDSRVLSDDRMNFVDKELAKETKARIYSTEIINQIIEDYNNGAEDVDMTPFFHGKTELRNPNIIYKLTLWEYSELIECQRLTYFVEHYCVFENDKGLTTVKLRDYQKEILEVLEKEHYDEEKGIFIPDHKDLIWLCSRLVGKTTLACCVILHHMLFAQPGKAVSIIANKETTAQEILQKVIRVYTHLPFWMQTGVVSLSKNFIKLESGSNCTARNSSSTSSTGATNSLTVLDEFSKMSAAKQELIWASVYPTLSSSATSRCIVMSTPEGRHNRFYKIWDDAINGRNSFFPFKVEYWRIPEHTDPKWIEREKKNMGERIFRIEYELNFDEGEEKIISPRDMAFMERIKKTFVPVDIYGVPHRVSKKILWHPDFHPDRLTETDLYTMRFLLQIDTAQGKKSGDLNGGDPTSDWNVINIYKIELISVPRIMKNRLGYREVKMKDVIRFRLVGIYVDLEFNEEQCADAAKHIVFTIFKNGQGGSNGSFDNTRISIEINFNGVEWIKCLKTHPDFYSTLLIKTYHSLKATKKDFGFKTVGGQHGKGYWCEQGAVMLEKRQIIITQDAEHSSQSSILQLASFGKNERGSYQGMACHDDIAVTVFFVPIAIEQEEFIMWIEDWFMMLPQFDISYELRQLHLKILQLMDLYVTQEYDEDQYSVNDIKNLYSSAGSGFGQVTKTYDPYSLQTQQQQKSYSGGGFSPSPGFAPSAPGFPGQTGFGQYTQGSRFSPGAPGNNPFGYNPFQR